DDREPGLLAGEGEDLEPLAAQPLERVGRGARLERAAAQHAGAALRDAAGALEGLLGGLDRAGAGHDGERPAAHPHVAAYLDDRVLLLEVAARQLVGLQDGDHLLDARERLEVRRVHLPFVADDADHGGLLPFGHVRLEAVRLDLLEHGTDLLHGRARLHHDDHHLAPLGPFCARSGRSCGVSPRYWCLILAAGIFELTSSSTRITLAIAPGTSSSRAHIRGTSRHPIWRAAYAGKSAFRSGESVKIAVAMS